MILQLMVALFIGSPAGAYLPEQTFDTKKITEDPARSAKDKAHALARIGEHLLQPYALDFAFEVFGRALEFDATEPRAKFYLKTFAPLRTLRGIMVRMQPVIAETKDAAFARNHAHNVAQSWAFFRAGAPDIKTEAQLRGVLRDLGHAWREARAYYAEAPEPLDILTTWAEPSYTREWSEPVQMWSFDKDDGWALRDTDQWVLRRENANGTNIAAKVCSADQPAPGVYHLGECPFLTERPYTLDFADFEALRGYAAGHELLGLLGTAYQSDGALNLLARAQHQTLSDRELVEIMSGGGELDPAHELAQVRGLGTDLFGAVRWLARRQSELCTDRPGRLLSNGICLTNDNFNDDDLIKTLGLIEDTLAESPIAVSNGQGMHTFVRMHRIYDAPALDLRQLTPKFFSHQGWAQGPLPDPSLNGVFVNGDAEAFYRLGTAR